MYQNLIPLVKKMLVVDASKRISIDNIIIEAEKLMLTQSQSEPLVTPKSQSTQLNTGKVDKKPGVTVGKLGIGRNADKLKTIIGKRSTSN